MKVLRRDGLIGGVDFARKKADEDGESVDLRLEGNHVAKNKDKGSAL